MIQVVLGLGSNAPYGGLEPVELLSGACRELKKILAAPVFSSLYETRAMYYENQQNFYNMAVTGFVDDSASPFELLDEIHRIEEQFGRNRSKEIRFGPRSLDIDIEEFGSLVLNVPDLILPHPRMNERAFVLIPVLEILKKSADCNKKEAIISSLKKLPEQGVVQCSKTVQEKFLSLT